MNILHTTDLHFNKQWFEWIANQQENYDVFCITGDFLNDSKDETLLEQIEWITIWMKLFKKPLFVCSGNHDIEELENEDWLNKISNVYSDNSIKIIDGVKFGCIPYIAPNFIDFDECNIILYHLPPSNTTTSTHNKTNKDWGDKELSKLLRKKIISPKIILCGHLHHPTDTIDKINNTKIYNAGVNKENLIPNYHIIQI
ncbi:metallophosphoesterase family protein [Aliarcobacter cryaerophilus]|uniref:metallophosphoesterase family protein n=1 Tax=Aliarcobacter cryaerophilus TaxID=28198 RepID=UPI0009EB3AED|nr:metallophosphoesterase [Aliarcobacter cryaerophilus]